MPVLVNTLLSTYLREHAAEALANGRWIIARSRDVAQLLSDLAKYPRAATGRLVRLPGRLASDEVDQGLMNVAKEGSIEALSCLSSYGLAELWARWQWALKLTLEDTKNTFSASVPDGVPKRIQHIAILLDVLGGFGRTYPRR